MSKYNLISLFSLPTLKRCLAVIVIALLPATKANADISYTFIKMTCDGTSKSVEIAAFYDSDESGRKMTAVPEQDIYPLGERTDQPTKNEGACYLGKGEKISFIARQFALPKDDNFVLSINGQAIARHTLGYGEWKLSIRENDKGKYTLKYCPEFADLSFIDSEDIEKFYQHKKCEVSYFSNGTVQDSEIVDR